MDKLENSKMTSASAQLKLEDPGQMSSLHTSTSNDDLTKASYSINLEADTIGLSTEGTELLYDAVRNEAFSVIEALLKKTSSHNYYQHENVIQLAMRSQSVVQLLTLFFKYKPDVILYCASLPWDMSNDHLTTVVRTLMRLADGTDVCAVGRILEFVSTKNPKLTKDLLSCRTKTNEKLIDLQELLLSSFKLENPAVTIFLLREGADVNDYLNHDRRYPLHLACRYQRLGAAQLLLRLGADVNVTDQYGKTPFSAIFIHCHDERDYGLIAKLMIKHFACLISTGKKVNENDLLAIRKKPNLKKYYELCMEELDRMKTVKAADGLSHHCFFSKSIYELSLLMRNPNIFKQLRRSLLATETNRFTNFKASMMTKFGVARQMRSILVSRERELEDIFSENLPNIVLRDIARFSLDFERLERDYHLTKSSCYYNNHFLNAFINTAI